MDENPREQKTSMILILTKDSKNRIKKAVPQIRIPFELLNLSNIDEKFPSQIIAKAYVMRKLKQFNKLEPNVYYANLYAWSRGLRRFFQGEITQEDIENFEKGLFDF